MLVDETLANTIIDGQDKGPTRVFAGDIVEVWNAVGAFLVEWGKAEEITPHTEQPKVNNYQVEEKPEKPKRGKAKK